MVQAAHAAAQTAHDRSVLQCVRVGLHDTLSVGKAGAVCVPFPSVYVFAGHRGGEIDGARAGSSRRGVAALRVPGCACHPQYQAAIAAAPLAGKRHRLSEGRVEELRQLVTAAAAASWPTLAADVGLSCKSGEEAEPTVLQPVTSVHFGSAVDCACGTVIFLTDNLWANATCTMCCRLVREVPGVCLG